MSYQHIHLKGSNLKKLYDSCDIHITPFSNSIRVIKLTITNMETKETSEDIHTATSYLTETELNQKAKEISDDKVDKLLTISNISDNFNDLLYEYTKEYFK